jgi:hypothetical protein
MKDNKQHREIGMLFADEMMFENIIGHKNETRRPLWPQPPKDVEMKEHSKFPGYWIPYRGMKLANDVQGTRKDDCGFYAPYLVGDIIYGREAFCEFKETPIMNEAGRVIGSKKVKLKHPIYRSYPTLTDTEKKAYKWRPSIHMPKKLARWRTRVVEVRVERIQDITPKDCIEEGIELRDFPRYKPDLDTRGKGIPNSKEQNHLEVTREFSQRWNQHYMYGKHGKELCWSANPWVWVVKYVPFKLPDCKERTDGFSCNLIYPDSYHCEFALNLGNCPEHLELEW